MTLALHTKGRRTARTRRVPVSLIVGGLMLTAQLLLALFPSAVAPYAPDSFDYTALMQPPSLAHLFGTDNFGRDVLSRVIHAYSVDMQIAFFATALPFLFGTSVGAVIGYAGGLAETVFGRLVDAIITFPFLVLVIAIVAVLGPGLNNMYIAVGVVDWVFYARLAVAEVKVQKRLDYAEAGRAMGYSPMRIIFRHLMPNIITPLIVYWMTDMALAILLGSSLGYLGLGAQPPIAEWGVQIADAKNFMATAWWMSVFPGVAIVVAGLSFSLTGDGVAEKMRARR